MNSHSPREMLNRPELPQREKKLEDALWDILQAIEDRRSLATVKGIAESALKNDSQTVQANS